MTITFSPIGVIHSPFPTAAGTPIQPTTAAGAVGTVEILPHLAGALEGIEGFDRIWLLYQFHQTCGFRPTVVPFLDTQPRGLFATRSPSRPNPLGLSVVRLLAVRGNILDVADIDVVDGTPLLDVKPYVPLFDSFSPSRAGWMDEAGRPDATHADERFAPPKRVTITVLCENTAGRPWIMGEWGLSLWIETGGSTILLDTGLEHALAHNAATLGLDLSLADAVVLSHGHVDHVGGLETVLTAHPGVPVYLHPDSLLPRYSRMDAVGLEAGRAEPVGMSQTLKAMLEECAELRFVTGPTEIAPFVWVTGEIPRREPVEGTGGLGFLDPALIQPDLLPGDMALWIETQAGLLVILGCAHAGVINTLRHIQEVTGDAPITGVIGGTHLLVAKRERMEATIDALKALPLRMLAPCHCTGPKETHQLRNAFPDEFAVMSSGSRLVFPPPEAV